MAAEPGVHPALARLVGGWFWYGEVRGASAFSRWAREAADLPWPDLRLRFLHAYATQTAEEWGHVALWSRWLERRGLDPQPPPPEYVALMDAQDAQGTWSERLAGTHLVIEGMALAFLPDLAPLVPQDLRQAIERVHADEQGHVALGARWIRTFVEREPEGRRRVQETVERFAELGFALGAVTAPLLAELGVDVGAVARRVAEEVPARFEEAGLDASVFRALGGLAS